MRIAGLMPLNVFFERFDSARDKLTEIAKSGVIGEPLDELDKSGIRQAAYDVLGGIIRLPDHKYTKIKTFQKRKGDVTICRRMGMCYVPGDLMRDIKFAEKTYEIYLSYLKTRNHGNFIQAYSNGQVPLKDVIAASKKMMDAPKRDDCCQDTGDLR